jgi:hypothetical protein
METEEWINLPNKKGGDDIGTFQRKEEKERTREIEREKEEQRERERKRREKNESLKVD